MKCWLTLYISNSYSRIKVSKCIQNDCKIACIFWSHWWVILYYIMSCFGTLKHIHCSGKIMLSFLAPWYSDQNNVVNEALISNQTMSTFYYILISNVNTTLDAVCNSPLSRKVRATVLPFQKFSMSSEPSFFCVPQTVTKQMVPAPPVTGNRFSALHRRLVWMLLLDKGGNVDAIPVSINWQGC